MYSSLTLLITANVLHCSKKMQITALQKKQNHCTVTLAVWHCLELKAENTHIHSFDVKR